MDIGGRIRQLLKKRDMREYELANAIGVRDVSVSRYVTGERMPKANIVARMADALNTTTDYILGRTDDDTGYGD